MSTASITFLKSVTKKTGVYIITSSKYFRKQSKDKQIMVKIGYAKDFNHRLNSYLLYWPDGVYVYDIFLTTVANKRILEKSIHQYLNRKAKYVVSLHSHTEEWFLLSKNEIDSLVDLIVKNKHTVTDDGRAVFPFDKHRSVNLMIEANSAQGTDRIKPMDAELKRKLDAMIKKPLGTETKPYKKSKKSGSYKGTKSILSFSP